MPFVEIVCLANSRKYQGRCVAGIRTDGHGWMRPVGTGECGALTPDECRLDDGTDPRPLDLIRIEVSAPRPEPHQPENWLIGRRRWQLVSRPAPASWAPLVRESLHSGPELFGDEQARIAIATLAASRTHGSLALVMPNEIHWSISETDGKRRTRTRFQLGTAGYDLPITDIVWERRLSVLPIGTHPRESIGLAEGARILLTISLGEPFYDECYKLVAALIVIPQSWLDKRAEQLGRRLRVGRSRATMG